MTYMVTYVKCQHKKELDSHGGSAALARSVLHTRIAADFSVLWAHLDGCDAGRIACGPIANPTLSRHNLGRGEYP